VPVDVVWEGERWRDVALHLKGSWSYRDLSGKAAFKLDFGQFRDGQEFRGVRRLTLNNMVQDDSMLREHTYYWLCHELGIPAPRHGYARVYLNDELYGLYGVVETMDKQYVKQAWPEDPYGNLYEGQGADVVDGDDHYDVQVAGGVATPEDDVDALVDALADGDDFLAVIEEQFDAPALLAYLAMDAASGHTDGYVFRRNNYLLYHAPWTHRWYLSPWGVDQSFKRDTHVIHGDAEHPTSGRLAIDCVRDRACRDRYEQALLDVVDLWERVDAAGFVEAEWARIEGACEADPRREDPCDASDLVEFLLQRPTDVRGML
jgi:spore coat protein CotH